MNALEILQKRQSVGKLQAPAPDNKICEALIGSAIRAADHGNLTPWRFIFIRDSGLEKLGQVFLAAGLQNKPEMSVDEQTRLLSLPLRAPLIITVVARVQNHPKIPVHEQLFSAAAAAQNILNAAYASGFGAIWRTGEIASDPYVAKEMGLSAEEQIIGFIYLGTPVQPLGEAKPKATSDFFSYWP